MDMHPTLNPVPHYDGPCAFSCSRQYPRLLSHCCYQHVCRSGVLPSSLLRCCLLLFVSLWSRTAPTSGVTLWGQQISLCLIDTKDVSHLSFSLCGCAGTLGPSSPRHGASAPPAPPLTPPTGCRTLVRGWRRLRDSFRSSRVCCSRWEFPLPLPATLRRQAQPALRNRRLSTCARGAGSRQCLRP